MEVGLVKARQTEGFAALVKGGGLPQGKTEGLASLVKGGGLPLRQAGGISWKFMEFE